MRNIKESGRTQTSIEHIFMYMMQRKKYNKKNKTKKKKLINN